MWPEHKLGDFAISNWWTTSLLFLNTVPESKKPAISESANRFSYLPKNIPNFYLELF